MKTQLTLAIALTFGSSAALADSHAEKKAPDAAKKAPDAAKDAKKAPDAAKKEPVAKAPEPPKPDPSIAEYAKTMTGTWKCVGKAMTDPSKPNELQDGMKATITHKLSTELDKQWVESRLSAPMGKANYKFTEYTTYNALEKKWMSFSVDNWGGASWATSTGPKDGKIVWEGEAVGQVAMGPSHKSKVRHTVDISDPKNVKIKGEGSFDGKTWVTSHDVACKK
jgi:hypothetical protein